VVLFWLVTRDPGVPDEIWAQLQSDKRDADNREQQFRKPQDQEEEFQCQLAEKAALELRARRQAEEEADTEQ